MTEHGRLGYLASLQAEVTATANRVRQLIGQKHWLSDGMHKESILTEVLRRHLPETVRIGRGFVVSSHAPEVVSREQDILILDGRYEAPLLTADSLLVTLPEHVIAAISVKSQLRSSELRDTIRGLSSVYRVALTQEPIPEIATLGFFFADNLKPTDAVLRRTFVEASSRYLPELPHSAVRPVPFGPDLIVSTAGRVLRRDNARYELLSFRVGDLAVAQFMAYLYDRISTRLGGPMTQFSQVVREQSSSEKSGSTAISR
ncbi:MAG: hypothetical protein KC619_11405 [Myxococcales bacterium]|nr:hypothetical protein [Myxococcales bacterium]